MFILLGAYEALRTSFPLTLITPALVDPRR
jgi:hypothetical protein